MKERTKHWRKYHDSEEKTKMVGGISGGPLIQLPTLCKTAVFIGFAKACLDKSGRLLGERFHKDGCLI